MSNPVPVWRCEQCGAWHWRDLGGPYLTEDGWTLGPVCMTCADIETRNFGTVIYSIFRMWPAYRLPLTSEGVSIVHDHHEAEKGRRQHEGR